MSKLWLFVVFLVGFCFQTDADFINDTFPDYFMFGAATSAYQIEGAWNEQGKGPNIWDTYTHDYPWMIAGHANGDVACDSYHRYPEDVKLCAFMGLNFYRFSISWARVLPYGYSNYVNPYGIRFYNNVINDLLAHNVTPMVTIYHWDLPQTLQNVGGWANPLIVDWFHDYCKVLFDNFGDRVKYWLTVNEPENVCAIGYGTIYLAPGYVNQSGIADYQCGHNILLSHAKAYHLYKDNYQPWQNGYLGLSIGTTWYEPATNSTEDVEATFRKLMFNYGWFMNPIFSKTGNYPQIMIDRVGYRSALENFPTSRLPAFTPEQIEYIKGSVDFLGLNMYTSAVVANDPIDPIDVVSYWNDIGVLVWQPASWVNTSFPFYKVTPWGARKLLDFTKQYYGDFPIIITENGYADRGTLRDYKRIEFYNLYLNAIHDSMQYDNVDVRGFACWALIDNFEWDFAYTEKFGLNYVNFSKPDRQRLIKNSARCYKKIIATHKLDWDCTGNLEDFETTTLPIDVSTET